MRRSAWSLLLAAVLMLVVGCGIGLDAGAVDAPAARPARIHHRWPGCAALGAFRPPNSGLRIAGAGSVPAGFRATADLLRDAAADAA